MTQHKCPKFSLIEDIANKYSVELTQSVLDYTNDLTSKLYLTIKFGYGKIGIRDSLPHNTPAIYFTNEGSGIVGKTSQQLDSAVLSENILTCLEFHNVEGINAVINSLISLKHKIINGEYDEPLEILWREL